MVDRSLKIEIGIQQAAEHNADEQGGIDLLCNQRQRDCDDRRHKRPDAFAEAAGLSAVCHAESTYHDRSQNCHRKYHFQNTVSLHNNSSL